MTDPQGYDTTVAVYNLDTTKKPDPSMFKIDYTNLFQAKHYDLEHPNGAAAGAQPLTKRVASIAFPNDSLVRHVTFWIPLHAPHPDHLEYQFGARCASISSQVHQGRAARCAVPSGNKMRR